MITDELIKRTDIEIHDLIHSELKILMYETQRAIDDQIVYGSEQERLEGMLEAYSHIYSEIYRVVLDREEMK